MRSIKTRFSMFGLMHRLAMYLSQHLTRLSGRSGGKILIM
uniref:SYM n=1 Tax=Arundo donax TaxID=35708 RepID=A0A0A9C554_ARUDO